MSAVLLDQTRPGRLTFVVAILKWDADGSPPPMEIAEDDAENTWLPDVTEAAMVTVPATDPLLRVVEAYPDTVDALAVVGVVSGPPMYSPPADGSLPPPEPTMAKLTDVPSIAGFPLMSFTRNFIVEVDACPLPLIPIFCGEAETNSTFPVAGADMIITAVLLKEPTLAVTVTVPGTVDAVKVTLATPFEVMAWEVIVPMALLLRVKDTAVPSATFPPVEVVTAALMLDVVPVVIVEGVAVTSILAAVAAPLPEPVPMLAATPPLFSGRPLPPHE